tara:strand:+ start:5701 stop:6138 length:438 start_codon:yes stop_codon:yes gene_type:complete
MTAVNLKNPRKLIDTWESQAIEILSTNHFPTDFKAISDYMHDKTRDEEIRIAYSILFWINVWRQSKTKEEVIISWDHILKLIKDRDYEEKESFNEKKSIKDLNERVDFPAKERIKELSQSGLSPEEIIMRGFSFEKVNEALKNGA